MITRARGVLWFQRVESFTIRFHQLHQSTCCRRRVIGMRAQAGFALGGITVVLLVACALLGCSRPGSQSEDPAPTDVTADWPAWFEDVTDKVGLNFVHDG